MSDEPLTINTVAAELGLDERDVEPRGWYVGKLAADFLDRCDKPAMARYIDVTAVSPTPAGEGKTVITIGLAMALSRLGHRAIPTLREPSLAPVFGIKGGGAGGSRASLFPADEINLHFTGDLHAVTAATNLLAAMADNHAQRGLAPRLDPERIAWRRCVDLCDKGLADIETGLNHVRQAPQRRTGFDLTAASEVMTILALCTGLQDLRQRLGRIVIGYNPDGGVVTADDIQAAGAMAALMRDAVRPNLVQTCEGTPALVHSGPFGNIAHGNCSILADLAAVRLADYVVTESGFGADCGAEKFFDIKCRASGLKPSAEVLVCSVRSLKLHSGRFDVRPGRPLPEELLQENVAAVREGSSNLAAHLNIIKQFGLPVVVAVNRFPTDADAEIEEVKRLALELGATDVAVAEPYSAGSAGALELAEAVVNACDRPNSFDFLYPLDMPIAEKLRTVATRLYGAAEIDLEPSAQEQIARIEALGFGNLPVCIAKTQYSLSHDPHLLGRPHGYRFPIRDVRLAAGAGFVYALAGDIVTMPGLPKHPAATGIDLHGDGRITGLR